MKNLQLSDAMAEARYCLRKTVTRRLTSKYKAGDVVYHGEALIKAGAGAAWYRRDSSLVKDFSPPLPWKVYEWKWKRDVLPARFCPERCARSYSLIRDVRETSLHEMDESEALDEGVFQDDHGFYSVPGSGLGIFPTPLYAFKALWDVINGQRAPWKDNPLVFRIELGAPIDREQAWRLAGIQELEQRLLVAA